MWSMLSSLTSLQNNNKRYSVTSSEILNYIKLILFMKIPFDNAKHMEYRFIAGKHRTEDGVDFSFGASHKVDRKVLYCLYPSTTLFVSFQLMLLFLLISTMLEGWWHILSLLFVLSQWQGWSNISSQLQGWWHISICFESVAILMEYFPFILSQFSRHVSSLLWGIVMLVKQDSFILSQLQDWLHVSRLCRVNYKVDSTSPVCVESVTRLIAHLPFVSSHLQGW